MSLTMKDLERILGTNDNEVTQSEFERYIYGSHRGLDKHDDKWNTSTVTSDNGNDRDRDLFDISDDELDAIDNEIVEYFENGEKIDYVNWMCDLMGCGDVEKDFKDDMRCEDFICKLGYIEEDIINGVHVNKCENCRLFDSCGFNDFDNM